MNEDKVSNIERRPLASRELGVWKATARRLASTGISPNAISVSCMFFAAIAGAAFVATGWRGDMALTTRILWFVGALCVQLRLLANMLDGMVAIEQQRTSAVGELFNEVPDRIADAMILIGLGYAIGSDVALGCLAACVAIFVAYVRAMGKVAGGQQEFCGPMAKPQRMFVVTLAALMMALLPVDWLQWRLDHHVWSWPVAAALWVIILGGLITALRRLLRVARTLRGAQS